MRAQAPVGQTFPFPGPFPAGTTITFSIQPGRGGTGRVRIQGAFPNWTIEFEDSRDNDFNDIILTVTATGCQLFPTPPADPLLTNPAVQQALKDLWNNSNTTDPNPANRTEQGGWIIERNGVIEMIPFGGNANPGPCGANSPAGEMQSIQAMPGVKIIAFVHTHPQTHGAAAPTDGSCKGNRLPNKTFGDNPSAADEAVIAPPVVRDPNCN